MRSSLEYQQVKSPTSKSSCASISLVNHPYFLGGFFLTLCPAHILRVHACHKGKTVWFTRLRINGVPEPALLSVFARTCLQQSVFFRVHPLSVRGLTFTCMRGTVIFSNVLDFAVTYGLHALHAPLCLRRLDKPLMQYSATSK